MNQELRIVRFAGALLGGLWSVLVGLSVAFTAASLAIYIIIRGSFPTGNYSVLVVMLGGASLCLYYTSIYGIVSLPQKLTEATCLRLAPGGRTNVLAVRDRLLLLACICLVVGTILHSLVVLISRSYDQPVVYLHDVSSADLQRVLTVVAQTSFYMWILARWVKAPFHMTTLPILAGSNPQANMFLWWWPFTTFIVVALGVVVWRRFATREKVLSDGAVSRPIHSLDASATSCTAQFSAQRWQRFIALMRRHREKKYVALFDLLPGPGPGVRVMTSIGLTLFLVFAHNWATNGGFGYILLMFIGAFAMHFRALPLLPTLLLPVGLSRDRIALASVRAWFTRDLTIWVPAAGFAATWAYLSSAFGVWMPFASRQKLPWAEADPLIVHPSLGVISLALVALGIALSVRFFFSATPQVAKGQTVFS